MNDLTDWKHRVKLMLHRRGWELHRVDPDRSLSEHLLFLLPHLGINVILDVGAHHGEYCQFVRRLGYTGQIVSFEPVASSFATLSKNQSGDPRWQGFQVALGAESGERVINTMAGSTFNSFRAPAVADGSFVDNVVTGSETVNVVRLDEIFSQVAPDHDDPRVYLKMDTQGFDLEVLRGAARSLSSISAFQSEMSLRPIYENTNTLAAMLSEAAQLGFAPSGLFGLNHHTDFLLAELEGVFLRATADNN